MIPYGKHNINAKDIAAVKKTLQSNWLTQGPNVKEFEESIAEYCGANYAVAVNSGTAALHLAYLASGLKEGDEVITSPNTFVATSNMLLAVGAKPIFCDINPDTYNIDENNIESLITNKTRAIVPVDFGGRSCEYDYILDIAKKHNLLVIADSCHALGVQYKGVKLGSVADATTFSFHPVKSITTAEGGAMLTNNKSVYEKALLLRSHGIHKDRDGKNVMTELGYNYRMPDVLASLGTSQLKRLDEFLAARRKVAGWYEKELSGLGNVFLPEPSNESGWHVYVIRTKNKKDRKPLYDHLLKKDIGVNFHYPAVYSHPYYRKHGYKGVALENMDTYHDTCITLPCHTKLTKTEVSYICNSIQEYFND